MTFYQSAEFESDMGGRFRVTRGYPTLAMLESDKIEAMPGDEWSDYETWEADSSEWLNIRIFDQTCCWCDNTATWTMTYARGDRKSLRDPACQAHMREFQAGYDHVRTFVQGD